MATKTFKIGLSTSDKSAMAQDVYERLIAMCFDEYDSTKTYNAGDFVVYENPADTFKLYKCLEDNVTGTWNSAKWELATFQDLVDDVEGAVASVDGKANVDGNYPTLTAGLADNLTPYSEDSGDTQDNPFISQGTGTNNNNEIVTVGDYALLREKQGHTLVVNQRVSSLVSTKTVSDVTFTNNSDGTLTINGTASAEIGTGSVGEDLTANSIIPRRNHYVLISINKEDIPSGFYFGVSGYAIDKVKSFIFHESNDTDWNGRITCHILPGTVINSVKIRPMVIDLTQMFNGDIPQDLLDHPEHFSWYYNGDLSYNTGTLVNSNSERLVSTKRNLWDEVYDFKGVNSVTGEVGSWNDRIASTNFIKVVPNAKYYINKTNMYVLQYDKNYNYLGGAIFDSTGFIYSQNNAFVFNIVPNCAYIKFSCVNNSYGTTYNNDITISLYYTPEQGGEGYSEYYPYEAPYVVDTGDEVLRQAGSVKDYKTPDGVVYRVVSVVDLAESGWSYSNDTHAFTKTVSGIIGSNTGKANAICSKYDISIFDSANSQLDKTIQIRESGLMILKDSSLNGDTSLINGTLYCQLATPTTEQGTTFSENLPINDYGMLYWQESNGVPQGAEIFYPVNYKGFLDDIYSRTSGDAEELVIQSELSASETARDTVDTQLQNAIGGTLRHILAGNENLDFDGTTFVDLGTQTWTYNSTYQYFYIELQDMKTPSKVSGNSILLCTLYKTDDLKYSGGMGDATNRTIRQCADGSGNNHTVIVKDTNYTDANTFKAAMKGVLLAYEKA